MFEYATGGLPAIGFLPHGQCFLWFRELLLLHVVADALITLAYYSIPLALVYFVRRRRDVEMRGLVVMFATFILACGTTHALAIWTVWVPDYWLSGYIKAFTAAVSLTTAVAVWLLMPKALALPSPAQLRREMETRERATLALEESERRFRSAFDHAAIGMALVSLEGRWLQVNHALCDILGYSQEELLTTDFQSITHPDDLGTDLGHVRALLAGERISYQMEKRYIHKAGHEIWILLAVSLLRDTAGRPLYFISQIENIDARKRIQQELEQRVADRTRDLARANAELEESNRQLKRLARFDELTGLCNRRHLMECLDKALSMARRYQTPLCLMMLDADHFKDLNDNHGHAAGDRVLAALGRLIRDNLRASDIAGRYGGEEFCIALPQTEARDAMATAEKLRALIGEEAISWNGATLQITCSIGVSAWHPAIADLGELLDRADAALYGAKNAGRNRVVLYDPGGAGQD